jgi:hypothetical protein
MLATIWRADVQSSQAQQRRTAFRGGPDPLERPRWLRAERGMPPYRPVRVGGAGRPCRERGPAEVLRAWKSNTGCRDARGSAAGTGPSVADTNSHVGRVLTSSPYREFARLSPRRLARLPGCRSWMCSRLS